MLKLSKNHIVKIAQPKVVVANGDEPSGADVDEDEGLEAEGFEGEEKTEAKDDLDTAKAKGKELDADHDADDEDADDDGDGDADLEPEKKKKHDARLEAAKPHAQRLVELHKAKKDLMNQVSLLDDEINKHLPVLQALDPKAKHEAYADDKEIKSLVKVRKEEKEKKKKKLPKKAQLEVVEGLLKVAEVLDYAGDPEGVSLVESMLQIFAKKDDGMPKYDVQTVEKTERKYPEVKAVAPTMSTRNCPDHYGVQMKRVAEGTFQCELDGRMYNWNQGFKNYNGDVYPAAPIRSVDFPDTTERMFETREMATNKKTK